MSSSTLRDELYEQVRGDLFGNRKRKTLEQALQEALDNTTPERPGHPNKGTEEADEEINPGECI